MKVLQKIVYLKLTMMCNEVSYTDSIINIASFIKFVFFDSYTLKEKNHCIIKF